MPLISLIIGHKHLMDLLLRVVVVVLVIAVYLMYIILRCPLAEYLVASVAIDDYIRHGKAYSSLVQMVHTGDEVTLIFLIPHLVVFTRGDEIRRVEIYQVILFVINPVEELYEVLIMPLGMFYFRLTEIIIKSHKRIVIKVEIAYRQIEFAFLVESSHTVESVDKQEIEHHCILHTTIVEILSHAVITSAIVILDFF